MAAPTLDDVRGMISDRTGTAKSEITLDSDLQDLGLESKDLSNLLSQSEEKYDVKVSESDFSDVRTVGDLYQRLIAK